MAEAADLLTPKVVATRTFAWEAGTTKQQIDRILQTNYAFINLNPYDVLQLHPEATEDEIKVRYRKISALVHPDKCPDDAERAGLAFQEVKNAHLALLNADSRASVLAIINAATAEASKEFKRMSKGGKKPPRPLEEEVVRQTRMAFARVDHQKQNYERRMKKHADREWEKEVAEKKAMLDDVERQKQWELGRDTRVNSWKEHKTDDVRQKDGLKRRNELEYGPKAKEGSEYKKSWR